MSATTSVMLRKTPKRAFTLPEIIANYSSNTIRSSYTTWAKKSTTALSPTDQTLFLDASSSQFRNFSTYTPKPPDPQPLVALAYDYIDDDENGNSEVDETLDRRINSLTTEQDSTKITTGVTGIIEDDVNYLISRKNSTSARALKNGKSKNNHLSLTNSISGPPSITSKFNPTFNSIHRITCSTNSDSSGTAGSDGINSINQPYPPPSSAELEGDLGGKIFRKGGGNGGGGRSRCPKCGTYVTFKCDFEDNTFYCASCAGWFAGARAMEAAQVSNLQVSASAAGNPMLEEGVAKELRKTHKKVSTNGGSEQEIVMRHVSILLKH